MNFYLSWLRIALLVSIFALVTAGGVWVALVPNVVARIAGAAIALVGAICVIGFCLPARRAGVQVRFGEHGIEDHRRAYGLITWRDIRGVRTRGFGVLVIDVADPEKYLDRAPEEDRVTESMDTDLLGGPIHVDFHILTPGMRAACAYIRTQHPEITIGKV